MSSGLGALSAAATDRVPPAPAAAPAFGCWFWSAAEFEPEGYRPFLDLVGRHAAFDRLTTSLRVAGHEVSFKIAPAPFRGHCCNSRWRGSGG